MAGSHEQELLCLFLLPVTERRSGLMHYDSSEANLYSQINFILNALFFCLRAENSIPQFHELFCHESAKIRKKLGLDYRHTIPLGGHPGKKSRLIQENVAYFAWHEVAKCIRSSTFSEIGETGIESRMTLEVRFANCVVVHWKCTGPKML